MPRANNLAGLARRGLDGSANRYIYAPKASRQKATRGALKHLLRTYFDNSLEKAVTAMLGAGPRASIISAIVALRVSS